MKENIAGWGIAYGRKRERLAVPGRGNRGGTP